MPTKYTDCNECCNMDFVSIGINIFDTHKANIQKRNILYNKGLPEEICQLILRKYVNTLTKCSFCTMKLCDHHAKRASDNGQYYRNNPCLMCDRCCWCEIG